MRLFCLSGINITGKNGATAPVFLAMTEEVDALDPTKLYHSEINLFGKRSVERLNIHVLDRMSQKAILDEMETMRRKFRDVAVRDGIMHD